MKIIVFSDSHGIKNDMMSAIEEEKPDTVIYLGDGIRDFIDICDNYNFYSCIVEGNCDFASYGFAENLLMEFEGILFYITHGANERVKAGLTTLYYKAMEAECDVALFGHTHRQYAEVKAGGSFKDLLLFNPGSIHNGYYGIINVSNQKIKSYELKSI